MTSKAQEAAPGANNVSEPSLDTVAIRGRAVAVADAIDAYEDRVCDLASLAGTALTAASDVPALLDALSQAQARVSLLEGVGTEAIMEVLLAHFGFSRMWQPSADQNADLRALANKLCAALSEATLDGVGKDEEACSPSALDAPVSAPSGGSASPLEDQ